ncbi:unnamed protein product [Medioppia subpectinata]|uniref:Uncharacterized protein n=1 Tax=Medioppia subpectinata TaxID=1979941 RepID=A0A7R9PT81_9ACAR|nr:unnamed protein product [Medioppia subpectinata]CAG2100156.1 unnamed protein product [Medioppia subpectinata]
MDSMKAWIGGRVSDGWAARLANWWSSRTVLDVKAPEVPPIADNCPVFPIEWSAAYALFGNYRIDVQSMVFGDDGIALAGIAANGGPSDVTHDLIIPFSQMQCLFVCSDAILPVLVIKPKPELNRLIQECLQLGSDSPNEFKMDVNSSDTSLRYIVILSKCEISEQFADVLLKKCLLVNDDCDCNEMNEEVARGYLIRPQMPLMEALFGDSESDSE